MVVGSRLKSTNDPFQILLGSSGKNTSFNMALISFVLLFLLIILIWIADKDRAQSALSYRFGVFWVCLAVISSNISIGLGDFSIPISILTICEMCIVIFKNGHKDFYVTKLKFSRSVILGILVGLLFSILVITFKHISGFILFTFADDKLLANLLTLLLISINEELAFRSLILGHLVSRVKVQPDLANLIQAGLFTLAHLPKYYADNPSFLLIVFLIAIALGYITLRTKNITGAIVAHYLINFLPLIT